MTEIELDRRPSTSVEECADFGHNTEHSKQEVNDLIPNKQREQDKEEESPTTEYRPIQQPQPQPPKTVPPSSSAGGFAFSAKTHRGISIGMINEQVHSSIGAPSFTSINDCIGATDMCHAALQVAHTKINTEPWRIFLKSCMSGAFISFATGVFITAISQGWTTVGSALLFPVGFVMLILIGCDLATGNFALIPLLYFYTHDRKHAIPLKIKQVLLNWLNVYSGNFAGCIWVAFLYWVSHDHYGKSNDNNDDSGLDDFEKMVLELGKGKVSVYAKNGLFVGWLVAFTKGILANWMVTTAVMFSVSTRSMIGKIFAMWIPVFTFVAQGFEHSVVNLFLIPLALFYRKRVDFTFGEWIWYNFVPVTLGNIFAGVFFTALPFYLVFLHRSHSKVNE